MAGHTVVPTAVSFPPAAGFVSLTATDWVVVALYGALTLSIGLRLARRAGRSVEDYFVAGRSLPWWIAGTSIAATWFASDAPLATAALVRRQGVFGNWLWWYEAAGILMLTFFYARLWRRAGVLTDAEVIELRYGGAPARILRGFSAVYQGLVKNAVVMGWVMLAMVKFSQVLLGWDAAVTLTVCVGLALVYTVASGLWGVVVTDVLQFVAGMLGSITLAGIVLARFGGLAGWPTRSGSSRARRRARWTWCRARRTHPRSRCCRSCA